MFFSLLLADKDLKPYCCCFFTFLLIWVSCVMTKYSERGTSKWGQVLHFFHRKPTEKKGKMFRVSLTRLLTCQLKSRNFIWGVCSSWNLICAGNAFLYIFWYQFMPPTGDSHHPKHSNNKMIAWHHSEIECSVVFQFHNFMQIFSNWSLKLALF